ncbi:protein of unknown function [Streptomyces murinus]
MAGLTVGGPWCSGRPVTALCGAQTGAALATVIGEYPSQLGTVTVRRQADGKAGTDTRAPVSQETGHGTSRADPRGAGA